MLSPLTLWLLNLLALAVTSAIIHAMLTSPAVLGTRTRTLTDPGIPGRGELLILFVSLFMFILGGKLTLIRHFGSDVPFGDQWRTEGWLLYVPYLKNTLSIPDMFSPHNEHRIFFTRLLTLTLFDLNRQWDARLQMCVNAVVHALIGTGLSYFLWVTFRRRFLKTITVAVALAFCLPFSWENTLWGFQSQFYLLIGFSLAAIWLMLLHKPFTLQWWCGILSAMCALVSMASGLLAPAAVLVMALLRTIAQPGERRGLAPTLIAALLLLSLGLAAHVFPAGAGGRLGAPDMKVFFLNLGTLLAWPCDATWPGILLWAPMLALLTGCLIKGEKFSEPGRIFTLALGVWVFGQCAAIALGRGGSGLGGVSFRYTDVLSIGIVANMLALAMLAYDGKKSFCGRIFQGCALLFSVFVLVNIFEFTRKCLYADIPARLEMAERGAANIRHFLRTGNPVYLEGKSYADIPYPSAPPLIKWLREPLIRGILPVSIRDPLKVFPSAPENRAFVAKGAYHGTADYNSLDFFGSFNEHGDAAQGTFSSAPIGASALPYLYLRVAGYLKDKGLNLEVRETGTGRSTIVRVGSNPAEKWTDAVIQSPAGTFEITAADKSHKRWFAFTPPAEMGGLSRMAWSIVNAGDYILFIGFLASIVVISRNTKGCLRT